MAARKRSEKQPDTVFALWFGFVGAPPTLQSLHKTRAGAEAEAQDQAQARNSRGDTFRKERAGLWVNLDDQAFKVSTLTVHD